MSIEPFESRPEEKEEELSDEEMARAMLKPFLVQWEIARDKDKDQQAKGDE